KNGSQSPVGETIKGWIRKLPFFMGLNYYRRKIYDSPLFDFTVKPLAARLAEWPRALVLDITNRCNAKCSWCPQPELEDLGAMKMPLYRKIIDDYAVRGGVIRFGTFGEPLMDKTFGEKISYLKKYPSIRKVEVVTNAFFLNEKIVPTLLENNVDVEISLDELEKDTFEEIKKMSYDVVRANILDFLDRNDRSPRPVKVNFRVKSSLSREDTMAHELFRKIVSHQCTLEITPIEEDSITNWGGRFDKTAFYEDHMKDAAIVKKYNYKEFNKENSSPCNQLWKWMVVYWDGSVVLCCVDMFSSEVLGNLNDSAIEEVWNGPVLNKLRKQMIQRKRFEIPICQNCDLHLSWQDLKTYYEPDGSFSRHLNFIS
ncbi:MAG: radical SAM/SPASM domain-containing protein, partial [Nitrospinales bacterium]